MGADLKLLTSSKHASSVIFHHSSFHSSGNRGSVDASSFVAGGWRAMLPLPWSEMRSHSERRRECIMHYYKTLYWVTTDLFIHRLVVYLRWVLDVRHTCWNVHSISVRYGMFHIAQQCNQVIHLGFAEWLGKRSKELRGKYGKGFRRSRGHRKWWKNICNLCLKSKNKLHVTAYSGTILNTWKLFLWVLTDSAMTQCCNMWKAHIPTL